MVAYKPPFGNKINKNSDKTPNSRHYIFTQMMAVHFREFVFLTIQRKCPHNLARCEDEENYFIKYYQYIKFQSTGIINLPNLSSSFSPACHGALCTSILGRAIVSRRAVKPGLPYEIHFLLKLKITVKVSHRASFIPAFTGFAPNATFLFALLLLLILFTRYSKNNPSTTHFLQFIV